MLWHLAVSSDGSDGKAVPIFINETGVLRSLAGKRIWEAFLDKTRGITAEPGEQLSGQELEQLTQAAQEYAYDTFMEMKDDYDRKTEENYRKYRYALDLRIEAAGRIGIDNIRQHKLHALQVEKAEIETNYKNAKAVCPEFRLELLIHMQ